jgi:hypothetical protein
VAVIAAEPPHPTHVLATQLVSGILLPSFREGGTTATGTKRSVCFVE